MRIITLIFITIIVAIPAHSQLLPSKTDFGIKSGINSSNAYKNQFYESNTTSIIGFYFGGFASFKISKKFAFQAELVYARQGFKEYINDPNLKYDQKIKLDYFNFPLNFQYIINSKIYVETGIQLDYLTQATAEAKNITDAGAPKHFLISGKSKKTDLKQQFNVMEIATSKSQLNALLTSLHINFIFGDNKTGEDKKLDAFLKEQKNTRKIILNHLNIDQKYANRLYRFVQWCDAFSLLICMDKIQPEGRKMEVSESPDGVVSQTFYKAEKEISVEPWVFKQDTFKVFYEFKIIEQLKFNSVAEFEAVCENTPVQREEFVFSK
jgi:hypothetical protein